MAVTIRVDTPARALRRWKWALLGLTLATAVGLLLLPASTGLTTGGGSNSITTPDTGGSVGYFTSIALDASGRPVVSYYDFTHKDLKILHCNDTNCAGGDESRTSPDGAGDVGWYTSLALDSTGNPVVSYYDSTNDDLRILHCDDVNCAAGGDSIASPDTGGDVGQYTSLALDGSGNPVVAYYDVTNGDLKLLHCDDPDCAAGGDSVTAVDTGGVVGTFASLALDASGNPVVSYRDTTNADLKVLHCNDANCTGGNESITIPDSTASTGTHTSIELDASGNPVVSYSGGTGNTLKILHCDDPNCSLLGESITSPDPVGATHEFTSLELDGAGNPVVSYYNFGPRQLKVLHCDDPNCVLVETPTVPDSQSFVGEYSSLALDGSGNPVVSYLDHFGGLKVLHCDDPACTLTGESITSPDGGVGAFSSLALDGAGNPVVSYRGGQLLKILHCDDPNCAPSGDSFSSPDSALNYPRDISLALDSAGRPVVSYYDFSNADLKILHCNDTNCTGGGESITSPDTVGDVGEYTSLTLDASGDPVVSYYDATNDTLKVLHCNDPNCSGGGESITSPETAGDRDLFTSIALDAAGNPVVSYFGGAGNADLKVLHCNDTNCSGGGESITSPDTTGSVGWYTSLALDSAGRPVVSYYDNNSGDGNLKVMHCNDVNCAGAAESFTTPDTTGDVGYSTSLLLDAAGNPVVSYYDYTNGDLKLLHCNDANCSPGGDTVVSPDTAGTVGSGPSLALDASGKPVVSYAGEGDLKLLHCGQPTCTGTKIVDTDGDGCPDSNEQQTAAGSELTGGRRDYLNPNDYFNPSHDGQNRIDDVLLVVDAYFIDSGNPSYNADTDRTLVGTNAWNLGPPNGLQRVDDIVNIVKQYFHDCS